MCLQALLVFGLDHLFFSVIRLCLLLVLEETVNKHPLFAVSELLPLCRDASAISDVFPGAYEHKEYQESPWILHNFASISLKCLNSDLVIQTPKWEIV